MKATIDKFLTMGFNRVFVAGDDLEAAAISLKSDIAARVGKGSV